MKASIMDEQSKVNYNINVMTLAKLGDAYINPMMVSEITPTETGCDVYMVGGSVLQFTITAARAASLIQAATVSFGNRPSVPGKMSRSLGQAFGKLFLNEK